MSALTAPTFPPYEHSSRWSWTQTFRVADAVRIYAGAFTGIPGTGGLTSTRGYLQRWQNVATTLWTGIAEAQSWTGGLITSAQSGTVSNVNSVLGATSLDPDPEISVEMGPVILKNVSVAGVSAQSDCWRTLVYCTTDNYADLSTTASIAPAIGKVVYWYSSTNCDVLLFGAIRVTNIV
jgi:hypothetical protein